MFKILSICKGGGYRYCSTEPLHPKANSNGLYPLHRVLMENKLGRLLLPNEEVHHKDEDKTNDVIDNLEVLTKREHGKLHHAEIELIKVNCSACKKSFDIKPHIYRLRFGRNKNGIFCSRSCGTKKQHLVK